MDTVTADGIAAAAGMDGGQAGSQGAGGGAGAASASRTGNAGHDGTSQGGSAALANAASANAAGNAGAATGQAGVANAGQNQNAGQPGCQNASQTGTGQGGGDAVPAAAANAGQEAGQGADADNLPIKDWSGVGDLGIDRDKCDQAMLASFGKPAVELGLTPAQARGLVKWQAEYAKASQEASLARESEALRAAWGQSHDANLRAVVNLCARLDREPGLEGFTEALRMSGAAGNAVVVRGLHVLAGTLGEDRAGSLSGSGSAPETPYDGIVAAFARARGGRKAD